MIERTDMHQYDTRFDSQRFMALATFRHAPNYQERLTAEKAYLEQQLKTDLGERQGLSVSTVYYQIIDGKLYSQGFSEPAEVVFRRGMYRNPADFKRDEARDASFQFMQSILADPKVPDGLTVLIASPRGQEGSDEEDNYVDGFSRLGNQVVQRRYKSNLTNENYRRKFSEIDPKVSQLLPEYPTDVNLISTPVIVSPDMAFWDPKKVKDFLFQREMGMSKEEFDELLLAMAPLLTSYMNTAVERPWALKELDTEYVAFHKGAELKKQEKIKDDVVPLTFEGITKQGILFLAEEDIKISGGSCGSGGCSVGSFGTRINFESDIYGDLSFNCPSCGKENIRERGKLMTSCKNPDCKDPQSVLPPGLRGIRL